LLRTAYIFDNIIKQCDIKEPTDVVTH